MPKEGLTGKQERFCQEYVIDFNATQSYKRAGYSAKSDVVAGVEGFKLLKNPKITTRIAELVKEQSEILKFDPDRVLLEIKRISLSNIQDLFDDNGHLRPIKDLPEDIARAISSIDVQTFGGDNGVPTTVTKLRLWNKLDALDKAAKIFKMFEDSESNSDNNSPKTIEVRFI